jgi:hypothetical protein
MKKLFSIIILFFEAYGQSLLEDKETPYERIDRTCGSEFYF